MLPCVKVHVSLEAVFAIKLFIAARERALQDLVSFVRPFFSLLHFLFGFLCRFLGCLVITSHNLNCIRAMLFFLRN